MDITDELLFTHAAEARNIWLFTLPADEELPHITCSKQFARRMQKIIREQRRTPTINRILRYTKRSIAAVLAIFIISFGSLMTVQAYRERIIAVIISIFNELTDFRFQTQHPSSDDVSLHDLSFGFIPDGMYLVEDSSFTRQRRTIVYENDDGLFFELTQQSVISDGQYGMILDTENSNYKKTTINNHEAYINEKVGDCSITWIVQNTIYNLYGNLPTDNLITIAEKIKIFTN